MLRKIRDNLAALAIQFKLMDKFQVTVQPQGRTFEVSEGETILDAALRQNVILPYGCRSGNCGTCQVKLLSGDNPQVPKGDGDAPVRFYIAHMPEWKHDLGQQIDEVIANVVPDVYRKVRWNQPFYGVDADTVFATPRRSRSRSTTALRSNHPRRKPPSTPTSATSTSTKATTSTRPNSRTGSAKPANSPARRCNHQS
jgi:ferredoxin